MPHISYTNPVCMWVFAFVAVGAISSRSEADKPAEKVWSTSNFLDFADGSFSDGGVNTYVTADGTVRLINQWDLDNDGNIDVVLPNDHNHNDRVDLFIYPGKKGRFDANLWKQLPTDGGQAVAIVDLNLDGHLELVVANDSNATTTDLDSYIYWGSEQGFNAARRTGLPTKGAQAIAIEDLNGDRHPEIVFANSGLEYHVSVDRSNESYIYWGSSQGYSAQQRSTLTTVNARDVEVADLDQDGIVEVIFAQQGNTADEGGAIVYWGGPNGEYSGEHSTFLPGERSSSLAISDLNGDGIADIVLANMNDLHPPPGKPMSFGGSPEADTFVYWGSEHGYDPARRQVLPSVGNADVAVADLNGDELLDLVLTSYHAGVTRSHPSYVYWNGPQGFDPSEVKMLPTNSASGVLVADYNRDGHKDILFACHSKNGNHRNDSFLYWGSDDGYSEARRSLLPGLGPHFLSGTDAGHIYDRGDAYDYISPPFDAGEGAHFDNIDWQGETPFRTSFRFQVRVASSRENLVSASWQGPRGAESYFRKAHAKLSGLPEKLQWIQYKASLISPDSANTPILHSVSITYH